MRARLSAWLMACIATLVLAGCATKEQFVNQIEKGSVATEEATNRLLLLNVVRAYHRRPMHFVRINEMRGPMGFGGPTVTIPTPLGGDRTHAYNISSVIKADQPQFGLQLLDNQDFYRGVTAPIKQETIQYFLEQGWPQQVLLHLFIREIEEYDAHGRRTEWVNYPENDAYFSAFQAKLQTFVGCEWAMEVVETAVPYGPALALEKATAPQQITALKGAFELQPVQVNDGGTMRTLYQPYTVKKAAGLKLVPIDANQPCRHLAGQGPSIAALKSDADPAPARKLVLTPRSTEAIIYYLGEISRRYLDGPFDNRDLKGTPVRIDLQKYRVAVPAGQSVAPAASVKSSLFVMQKGAPGPHAIEVSYDGETYSIPKDAGRSMHVLSLLTQLLALHNKAAEAPTTQSVRIIN